MNLDTNQLGGHELFRAINNGHSEIVKLLLVNGADPNACSITLKSLGLAAIYGNAAIIKHLLDADADPFMPGKLTFDFDSSSVPINIARKYGHEEIFNQFYDLNARIRRTDLVATGSGNPTATEPSAINKTTPANIDHITATTNSSAWDVL